MSRIWFHLGKQHARKGKERKIPKDFGTNYTALHEYDAGYDAGLSIERQLTEHCEEDARYQRINGGEC